MTNRINIQKLIILGNILFYFRTQYKIQAKNLFCSSDNLSPVNNSIERQKIQPTPTVDPLSKNQRDNYNDFFI